MIVQIEKKKNADQQLDTPQMVEFVSENGRKYWWKRRKCWLLAFSPFPTMFSKTFFFGPLKTLD